MDSKMTYNFTRKEDEAVRKLKARLLDKHGLDEADGYKIYRFLKARNFDENLAEDMLIKHYQWRKDYAVDTIRDDFEMPEVIKKFFQYVLIGHDMEGNPNVFLKLGALDIKGIIKSVKKEHILKYIVYYFTGCENYLKELSQKWGKPMEFWNIIVDAADFPISQGIYRPTAYLLRDVFNLYEANYPERLKLAYAVNASMGFFIGFNTVKVFLSGSILQKIRVFGKDGWKEEFSQTMNMDEMPAFLGGRRTDPDGNEMCVTTVNHCGTIPEHYYFRSSSRRLCGQPGVKIYNLSRKGKINISFNVVEPGSFIEWEFESDKNDIAFGLFFKGKIDSKLKPIQLMETQRVSAHMHIETGTYKCNKMGIYILILDNTYSWILPKKIYCRTSIVPPAERVAK